MDGMSCCGGWRSPGVVLAFFLFLIAPITCQGLSADDAGEVEWRWKGLGAAQSVAFSESGKRVALLSSRGAVGIAPLKSGEMSWRHDLGGREAAAGGHVGFVKKFVVSMSHKGEHVRAWNAASGELEWQHRREGGGIESEDATALLVINDNGKGKKADSMQGYGEWVLVVVGRDVEMFNGTSGTMMWRTTLEGEGKVHRVSAGFDWAGFAAVAVIGPEGAVSLNVLNLADGSVFVKPEGQHKYSGMPLEIRVAGALQKWHAVARMPNGDLETATTIGLGEGVEKLDIEGKATSFSVSGDGRTIGAILQSSTGVIMRISPRKILATIEDVYAVARLEPDIFAFAGSKEGKIFFQVYNKEDGALEHDEKSPLDAGSHGVPSLLKFMRYTRKGKEAIGYRSIISTTGGSLALLQQGTTVWVRDEALADVRDVHFSELPRHHSLIQDESRSRTQMIKDGFRMQLLSLKVKFKYASAEEAKELVHLRQLASGRSITSQDASGFRKLLVLGTGTGRIIAVHNGDGRIIWSVTIPEIASVVKVLSFRNGGGKTDKSPELMVVGKCTSGKSIFVWLRAHDGHIVHTEQAEYTVQHMLKVPGSGHDENGEHDIFLSVDAEQGIHALPNTAAAWGHVQTAVKSMYLFDVESEKGTLYGYKLMGSEDGRGITVEASWRHHFNGVISVFTKSPEDYTYSRARVLGDRSLEIKYLNPHLALVAVERDSRITTNLIDTVSGHIVHTTYHDHVSGPVHATLCENWVAYQFFDQRTSRNQLVTLDLFEEKVHGKDQSVGDLISQSFSSSGKDAKASSFSRSSVRVTSQTHFLGASVKTMAVSSTAASITGRHLLLGTDADQIYAMDRRFLDPRRPEKATSVSREEGLPPYQQNLPIMPTGFVTHADTVLQLRGIATSPAGLESASLVLAYGLDLFYTRIAPSKYFDLLSADFSYSLLLITIVGLTVATAVVGVMVKQSEVKKKWM